MLGNRESANVFYLKVKNTKKGEKPIIEVSQKKDDKYEIIQTVTSVSGVLEKIEEHSYTWEGETIKTLKFHIRDTNALNKNHDQELYILTMNFNGLSRNILNTLASSKSLIGSVEFSFYQNKNGYPSVGILVNGERGEWMYPVEELNKMVEVVKNKKGEVVSTDTTELDEFFLKALKNEIIPKLGGISGMAATLDKDPETISQEQAQPPLPEDDSSDLPF